MERSQMDQRRERKWTFRTWIQRAKCAGRGPWECAYVAASFKIAISSASVTGMIAETRNAPLSHELFPIACKSAHCQICQFFASSAESTVEVLTLGTSVTHAAPGILLPADPDWRKRGMRSKLRASPLCFLTVGMQLESMELHQRRNSVWPHKFPPCPCSLLKKQLELFW